LIAQPSQPRIKRETQGGRGPENNVRRPVLALGCVGHATHDMALRRIADAKGVSPILILSDINMPGMTGLELLPKAKAARPDVPMIMITAYGDAETKRKALESCAEALFTKPSISGRCAARSTRGSSRLHDACNWPKVRFWG
jgi:CheY-like chemotaxis protein